MPPEYKTPGIYITEITSFHPEIPALPTSIPAFIGYTVNSEHLFLPKKISSLTEYENIFGIQDALHTHIKLFFANGGSEFVMISVGTDTNMPELGTADPEHGFLGGLHVLSNLEEPTLLVIPEATRLPQNEYATLVKDMLQHCAQAKNRFAIIDVYGGADCNESIIAQHRQDVGIENLKYGASYVPFIRVLSSDASSPVIDVPPSAAIAGVVCRNDANRGIWKSPANLDLKEVTQPTATIDDRFNEYLNVDTVSGISINAIRTFPGKGVLVWGARTLNGNDNEWRYIPVRRFFSWARACIEKGLAPLTFEPNDSTTWIKARQITENFLTNLWKQGAMMGNKMEEAFFVRAGLGDTMTQDDINNGRMICEIGMAVVRPAEFIIVRIDLIMQGK